MAAQILREGFLQGAAWILTSAPSIGTQFLEKKTNKVIIVIFPKGAITAKRQASINYGRKLVWRREKRKFVGGLNKGRNNQDNHNLYIYPNRAEFA